MQRSNVWAVAILPTLLLTACAQRDNGHSIMPEPASTGNKTSDMLAAMSGNAQAAVLGKTVSGGCNGTSAMFVGASTSDHSAFWSLRCADGRTFQAMIKADEVGTTSVMDCSVLKVTADIDCFVPLKDQANRTPRARKQINADIEGLPPPVRREMEESLKRAIGK